MFGGKQVVCGGCGQRYAAKQSRCPVCLVEQGEAQLRPVSEGGPTTLVRVYPGRNGYQRANRYAPEAETLGRLGWIPTGQVVTNLSLTVTYVRVELAPRPPVAPRQASDIAPAEPS